MNRITPATSYLTIPSPEENSSKQPSSPASPVTPSGSLRTPTLKPKSSFQSLTSKFFRSPAASTSALPVANADSDEAAAHGYQRMFDDAFLSAKIELGLPSEFKEKQADPAAWEATEQMISTRMSELSYFQTLVHQHASLFARGLPPAIAELAARVCANRQIGLIALCQTSNEGKEKTAKILSKLLNEPEISKDGRTEGQFYQERYKHYMVRLQGKTLSEQLKQFVAKVASLGQVIQTTENKKGKSVEVTRPNAHRMRQIMRAVTLHANHRILINDIWTRGKELTEAKHGGSLTVEQLAQSQKLQNPIDEAGTELKELIALSETLFMDRAEAMLSAPSDKNTAPAQYEGTDQREFRSNVAQRAQEIARKNDPTRLSVDDDDEWAVPDIADSQAGSIEEIMDDETRRQLRSASVELARLLEEGDGDPQDQLQAALGRFSPQFRQSIDLAHEMFAAREGNLPPR